MEQNVFSNQFSVTSTQFLAALRAGKPAVTEDRLLTTTLPVLSVFCPLEVGIIREAPSAGRTPTLTVTVAYRLPVVKNYFDPTRNAS
jgi:hypothetical protein